VREIRGAAYLSDVAQESSMTRGRDRHKKMHDMKISSRTKLPE